MTASPFCSIKTHELGVYCEQFLSLIKTSELFFPNNFLNHLFSKKSEISSLIQKIKHVGIWNFCLFTNFHPWKVPSKKTFYFSVILWFFPVTCWGKESQVIKKLTFFLYYFSPCLEKSSGFQIRWRLFSLYINSVLWSSSSTIITPLFTTQRTYPTWI